MTPNWNSAVVLGHASSLLIELSTGSFIDYDRYSTQSSCRLGLLETDAIEFIDVVTMTEIRAHSSQTRALRSCVW